MNEPSPTPAETPPAAGAEPPTPPESPAPARPVRLTSVLGSIAAAALCLAWFLPWVHVDPELVRDFEATVEREVEAREGATEGGEDFLRLARTMREQEALKGVDFIHWLRAGQTFSRELDAEVNPGVAADAHLRRLRLVQVLLYGIPLAAFLLAAHFLMHRFRRARAPVLILAILTGLAAIVTAATLDFTQAFIAGALAEGQATLGWGWRLLLGGGAALAIAGVFGVRPRNWFRVYVISAATAAALGVIALRYLDTGGVW